MADTTNSTWAARLAPTQPGDGIARRTPGCGAVGRAAVRPVVAGGAANPIRLTVTDRQIEERVKVYVIEPVTARHLLAVRTLE